MLRSVHKYLLQFFVTFCMAACAGVSEIGNPSEGDSNFISFNVSETMTKVSNDDITDHLLCIYIYDDGNLLGGREWSEWSNYRLKYDSSSDCWRFWNTSTNSFEDIEWGTGEHEFYAYSDTRYYILGVGDVLPAYDVDDKSLKHTGVINIAQVNSYAERPNQNYKKDMIYASATRNVEDDGYGPVSLEFDHALASLLIEVKNNSNSDKNITICSLRDVRLDAENPTLDFVNGIFTASVVSVDNDGIAFGGGTAPGKGSFIATEGPVVIWPQPIENQWLDLSISGVPYVINIKDLDSETTDWEAGKLYHYIVNIPSPVELESPSATISHTMTDGVLTGSAVTLDLGATQEQLSKIKGLTVNVKRDGTNYKTYSAGDDVVASSNTISISSGDRNYLPKGEYTVECSYMSGLDEVSFTIDNVVSPTPTGLTYNVTANADTPGKLTVTDASVNISQSVLDELPLSNISLNFADVNNNNKSYDVAISPVSNGADFTPVETEVDAGVYNLTSSVTFDGVVRETGGQYTVKAAPKVGWYVNNDGTFSETFDPDISIAKIFYVGDLSSEDDQLLAIGYTRGLAYEVNSSGNLQVHTGIQWTSYYFTVYGFSYGGYAAYGNTTERRGYTNTVAIKKTNAAVMANYGTETSDYTSTWFMPSYQEYLDIYNEDDEAKSIIDANIGYGVYDYGFMVSTLDTSDTSVYGQYVSKSGTLTKNTSTTTSRIYIRILAF